MSRCISRAGEYGDHVLADTGTAVERFVCSRCFVVAEDELFAEVDSLRAELAAERAKAERVEALCDEYRTNCDPDTKQAQVAEIFRAALTEGETGE